MSRRARYGVVGAACCATVILLFVAGHGGACAVQRFGIDQDTKKYGRSMDPEFCAALNERISSYDASCGSQLETADCG